MEELTAETGGRLSLKKKQQGKSIVIKADNSSWVYILKWS
jgi:hypothetical protein